MFWIILVVAMLIISIVSITIYEVLDKNIRLSDKYENLSDGMVITFIISLVIFIITSIANPIAAIDTKSHINVFNHQKQYIEAIEENKQNVLDIELAGLTKTKMELNGWLYESQYYAEHYGFFCYYPNEILELKPIK